VTRRAARLRRRRRARLTAAAGVAAVCALVIVIFAVRGIGESGGDGRVATPRSNSATQTGPTVTTTPSTTSPTTTTTEALSACGFTLAKADLHKPPQAAYGVYKPPKITLNGSVPNLAVARAYFVKATATSGKGNVIVKLKLDPRARAGPARVDIDNHFGFDIGKTNIDPQFDALLASGLQTLKQMPEVKFILTGYTDSTGSSATNQQLSERRAQEVVNYMVQRGAPANRLIARGAGEADPIADNNTPEGRALNRRLEGSVEGVTPFLPVLTPDGKPISLTKC
jgi:outer membrane protein OmpA-like peptidoglycan-associated protein